MLPWSTLGMPTEGSGAATGSPAVAQEGQFSGYSAGGAECLECLEAMGGFPAASVLMGQRETVASITGAPIPVGVLVASFVREHPKGGGGGASGSAAIESEGGVTRSRHGDREQGLCEKGGVTGSKRMEGDADAEGSASGANNGFESGSMKASVGAADEQQELPWFRKGKHLTVGARALAKHAHRSSESFWGIASGSQEKQNARAVRVLGRLLGRVAWWNWHPLPNGPFVFEVRTPEGYGARWGVE